jgi:hypothetical protein
MTEVTKGKSRSAVLTTHCEVIRFCREGREIKLTRGPLSAYRKHCLCRRNWLGETLDATAVNWPFTELNEVGPASCSLEIHELAAAM